MKRINVGSIDEIPHGECKIVKVDGREIGIFNVHGEFHAVRNICPHQFAPVCRGQVQGTTMPSEPGEFVWGMEGEVLICPWHGWEFDLIRGNSLFNSRVKLNTYPVEIDGPDVILLMK